MHHCKSDNIIGRQMNEEDALRLERWVQGMQEMGLVVETINNSEWVLIGKDGWEICRIKYFPDAAFCSRFKFSNE